MIKVVLLVLLALLVCGSIFGDSGKSFKDNISIKGVEKMLVYSTSGEVTIITEKRDDIFVELKTSSNGPRLYVEKGRELVIESKKKGLSKFFPTFKNSELRVYVPENFKRSLYIRNISGDVEISDITLESLELKLTSGDSELRNVKADKGYIKSTSGSVLIEESQIENLETKLTSGTLFIDDFKGKISGKSTSGSVSIDLEELAGDISYKLTSGSMKLNILSDELNSELNLKTTSGKIVCDFPVTATGEIKSKRLTGVSGNPDFNIDISCTSSSIYITN